MAQQPQRQNRDKERQRERERAIQRVEEQEHQRHRTVPSIRHNIGTVPRVGFRSYLPLPLDSFSPFPTVCQIALATGSTGHTSHRSVLLLAGI